MEEFIFGFIVAGTIALTREAFERRRIRRFEALLRDMEARPQANGIRSKFQKARLRRLRGRLEASRLRFDELELRRRERRVRRLEAKTAEQSATAAMPRSSSGGVTSAIGQTTLKIFAGFGVIMFLLFLVVAVMPHGHHR